MKKGNMFKQNIYTFNYKICESGHTIYSGNGGVNSDFCKMCGAPFLIKCEKCDSLLPSSFQSSVYFTNGNPTNVPRPPGACDNCGNIFPWSLNKSLGGPASAQEALSTLLNTCTKFHSVARQLRDRYNERATLDIEDEYDVQDLIHSLLRLNFEDIRKEEWTPSYAGGSSRMDFLINPFGIVLEIKKTRKGLGAKELGKQLIDDIVRYKKHPDCKTLVCFIYDPEERVNNPKGFTTDLKNLDNEFDIEVFISPNR